MELFFRGVDDIFLENIGLRKKKSRILESSFISGDNITKYKTNFQ